MYRGENKPFSELICHENDTNNLELKVHYGASLCRNFNTSGGVPILTETFNDIRPKKDMLFFIYSELANAFLIEGDYQQGIDYYNRCIPLLKNPEFIYYEIAEVYDYEMKDKKMAYETYLKLQDLINSKPPESLNIQEKFILNATEYRIDQLKEELFFEGKLNESI